MRRLLPLLVLAASAWACSSAAAAAPPDPCLLITSKDATPVFGSAPGTPARAQAAGVRSCTYTVKHEKMTIETRALASASAFVASTKTIKGGVLPIATLKDAYSTDDGKEMLLWKGGTEITFSFVGVNPVFAEQTTLASTALGRV